VEILEEEFFYFIFIPFYLLQSLLQILLQILFTNITKFTKFITMLQNAHKIYYNDTKVNIKYII